MTKTIWKDASGATVPAQYVPSIDKKKTRLVKRLVKKAEKVQGQLRSLKSELFEQCDDLYELMKKEANVKSDGKGNYTISTFDKGLKVEVKVQNTISFDDNIQFAQQKIEDYVTEKAEGIDADLIKLVHLAFESNKGQLDTKRVLGLFKLNITHPLWQEAMELIRKSVDRNFSKRYARIWVRQDNGEYKAVELNFSKL